MTQTAILLTIQLEGVLSNVTKKCESFTKPCTQKIQISEDAAKYFVRDDSFVPQMHIKKFVWDKMNATERIKAHLSCIAEGKSFTYEIVK